MIESKDVSIQVDFSRKSGSVALAWGRYFPCINGLM